MLVTISGRDARTVPAETWSALSQLRWDGPGRPGVLAYTPVAKGNPFQQVLYSRLLSRNVLPVPSFDITTAAALLEGLPPEVDRVLHLHWLNVVLNRAMGDDDARRRLDGFVDTVARLKDQGVRIAWTVHNVLPHDLKREEFEVELRERVIALADIVHVMSPRTPELVAPWFALPPDRTYHCDHPGYQGVYADWVDRADARRDLGVPRDALVWVLMGAIKPYKGLTELLDAVDTVSRERPGEVVLLVAGAPDQARETTEFLDRAARHPAVRLYGRKVVPDDVQLLFRAGDVALVPYRRSLNSGALVLALSFGLPVVLPSDSGATPLVDDACAVVYDQDDPDGLTAALRSSSRLATPAAREAAAAAGQRIHRDAVSRAFADDLRAWLDGRALPVFPTDVAPGVVPDATTRATTGATTRATTDAARVVAAGVPPTSEAVPA